VTDAATSPRYRVVLPPGFLLFPVRDLDDAQLAQLVRDHYRSLPRDTFGPRIESVAEQIVAVARPARSASVIDLILPMGVPWRAPVSVAIALSLSAPGAASFDDDVAGERIDTEAGVAMRDETSHPIDDARPDEIVRRRTVQFTWAVPGTTQLLTAVSTVSAAADPELEPLVEGLVELSDLMMTTLRWDTAAADPREAD
jgi:hypothetical protein